MLFISGTAPGSAARRRRAVGAAALAVALCCNTGLMALSLGTNRIGAEGAEALAGALRGNTVFTELRLDYNQISAVDAAALAEALCCNTVLTALSLDTNSIGAEGAAALVEALRGNTTPCSRRWTCTTTTSATRSGARSWRPAKRTGHGSRARSKLSRDQVMPGWAYRGSGLAYAVQRLRAISRSRRLTSRHPRDTPPSGPRFRVVMRVRPRSANSSACAGHRTRPNVVRRRSWAAGLS